MKKSAKKKTTAGKSVKAKNSSASAAAQQDIIGLLTMLVQKLTSFESKIDAVLSRLSSHQPAAVPNKPQPVTVPPAANKPPREARPMFKAVCADCSMDCEVPFKPKEGRQVYCKECFAKRRNNKPAFKPQDAVKPVQNVPAPAPAPAPKKAKAAKPAKPLKKKSRR